ncbi:NAD(P)-dependent oxidoreductase [Candidatus Daviesbacteria bacterium]|nr:NAD(P)-dependent oxidoreductase [Candidatus Daviesbacteria bacterium]
MKKVLVLGGSGLVGSKFIDLYSQDFEINAPDVKVLDILNKDQILQTIEKFNPDYIINFAAFTDVEASEDQKGDKNGICFQINSIGAKNVAEAAKDFNKHLVHISTEYIFDGTKEVSPYTEEDQPNPTNWYGQTKYFAEQFVQESSCQLSLVRICMPFSSYYELKKDVARFFLYELQHGNKIKAIEDQWITPTLVSDIAAALKTIIETGTTGLYHVSSTDSVTPLEFAKTIAETFQLDYSLIGKVSFDAYNQNKKAKLLKFSWLNPTKFEQKFGEGILHTIEESLIFLKKEIDEKAGNQI